MVGIIIIASILVVIVVIVLLIIVAHGIVLRSMLAERSIGSKRENLYGFCDSVLQVVSVVDLFRNVLVAVTRESFGHRRICQVSRDYP